MKMRSQPNLCAMLTILATLAVLLAGCGDEDNPTAPSDPNKPMYGSWNGTFTMRFRDGVVTQDPMTLRIEHDNVAISLSGAAYPANLQSLDATTVVFSFTCIGYVCDCAAARRGSTLNGVANLPQIAQGEFALTRPVQANVQALHATRLSDKLTD